MTSGEYIERRCGCAIPSSKGAHTQLSSPRKRGPITTVLSSARSKREAANGDKLRKCSDLGIWVPAFAGTTTEFVAHAGALIIVHPRSHDHLRPLVALAAIERVELLGGADQRRETLRGQRRLDLGRLERLPVGLLQALDDVLRRAGRRGKPHPEPDVEA